jgi:hypothetical protein
MIESEDGLPTHEMILTNAKDEEMINQKIFNKNLRALLFLSKGDNGQHRPDQHQIHPNSIGYFFHMQAII